MAADVKFVEDGHVVLIRCAKYVLVMNRQQFVDAIKQGKVYSRRQTLEARFAQGHEAGDSDARAYGG